MFRLSIIALVAALANATTPDNVSSRLMIHVSSIEKSGAKIENEFFGCAVEVLLASTRRVFVFNAFDMMLLLSCYSAQPFPDTTPLTAMGSAILILLNCK